MKLTVKYSATILSLIFCIVLAFSGVILIQFRSEIAQLNASGAATLRHSLLKEIQEKESISVRVLADTLTNPLYQLDMLKIGELVSAVNQRPDVLYIRVYDDQRRVVHDGTSDLALYGKVINDDLTVKSTEQGNILSQINGNELHISAPIRILDAKVGGVRVGYSLKRLLGHIERQQRDLEKNYTAVAAHELYSIGIIALAFAFAGLVIAVLLARSWSKPILLLASATARVGRGDYDVSIPINRSDEIGELAQSFANMMQNLESLRKKDLEQSEALRSANRQLQQANQELIKEVAERHRAEENLLRQNQRMHVLHEIDSAVRSTLERKVLINTLLDKVESLLPYSAITVKLWNRDTKQLEPISARNIDDETWIQAISSDRGELEPSHSWIVFDSKAPLVVNNSATDPRIRNGEFFRKNGLASYVGIPLTAEGETLGVLGFYRDRVRQVTNEEIEFLSTLAGQVAIAVYNSQLYETIKKQTMELKQANRAKDEFLNVMSHELRTPLNVINGYVQVLSDGVLGALAPEQARALRIINLQSADLLRMINDVLQVGSLESGNVQVNCHDTNITDLLAELKSSYSDLAKKNVAVHWNFLSVMPVIRTDGNKLKHILQNLINNALKFTDVGSIAVSCRSIPRAIQFVVKDTGIGIEQDKLPLIFEMFRQLDSSGTRSYGGAGLGLYIVKKFVELLNGTIEVESVPGEGSAFTVTVPEDPASGNCNFVSPVRAQVNG